MQLRNLLSALALTNTALATYSLDLVYQFANAFSGVGYVNIENIAVRSSNQDLVLNLVTGAIMVELNPDNPQPKVLVNISDAYPGAPGSLTGIVESQPNVFTVAAGNFIFGPNVPGGVAGINGTWSVWNVDLCGKKPHAYKLVDIPQASALNGIAKQPGKNNEDYVLIADSGLGAIWRVNYKTGAYSQWLASPLFANAPFFQLGINGLKSAYPYVYFTNSAFGFFGAVKVDENGNPASPPIPFVNATQGYSFDDFALDTAGNAYVAGPPNAVFKLEREVQNPIVIANSSLLLGPTAAAFRGKDLYVTTGGVGGGPQGPQSGQIFKISNAAAKLRRWTA